MAVLQPEDCVTVSERTTAISAGSDVPRRKSASPEEIARLLTAYVTTGDLRPGARIPSERRLAEELGVGRTVVREALKSLALVGLIESRHGDGTYVADSTPESFSRAVEWRLVAWGGERADVAEAIAVLDGDLAAMAAERRTEADLLELAAHLAEQEAALECRRPGRPRGGPPRVSGNDRRRRHQRHPGQRGRGAAGGCPDRGPGRDRGDRARRGPARPRGDPPA